MVIWKIIYNNEKINVKVKNMLNEIEKLKKKRW